MEKSRKEITREIFLLFIYFIIIWYQHAISRLNKTNRYVYNL